MLLEKKPKHPSDDCPERYSLLLVIANVQPGWANPQFEALFNEAVSFEPSYQYYYLDKANHLLAKWHGENGTWQKFAKDAIKLTPAHEGNSVYLRIMMSFDDEISKGPFSDSGVSWEMLKQGFLDNEQIYPDSPWILNNFCKLACLAGEKETARKLFKRIGARPFIEAWSDLHRVSEYKKWRDWAFDEAPSLNQKLSFPGGTEDVWEMLVLAKAGDPQAQYLAGEFYLRGELVERDRTEAERWYRKAADQGHRQAQNSLGTIYFNGDKPFERDFKEATKWYYFAAVQGDSNSASSLGYMYADGYGLEKNLVKAYVWYSQVTQWQEPKVKEIAAKLTPEQLATADLEAKKIREEIRLNMETSEIRPIDPNSIQVPEFKLAPQIKYEVVPQLKLPTGNLMDSIKWELSGGATFDGKILSLKNQGEAAAQMKVISSSNGCVLIATRLRHARPEAIVPGTPFLSANMTDGNTEGKRIFMGLLAPPPNNRKEGPWYKTDEIRATRFDGVKLRFGTAGKQEGSNTEIYDTKVIIFPSCKEANKAGEEYLRQ